MKVKMNRLLYGVVFFLCATLMGYAQQITVKGTVKDASGLPLAAASVVVKGTSHGTATDFDGNFELTANKGVVLVISSLGYKNQEVTVKGSQMNVVLQEEMQQLDDVVVVGYGVAKKKDVTGSVNLVTTKDFSKGQTLSADQLIQGKVAGVQITSGGGAPGDGQNIRVRGVGSLTLNSNPLVVVDGIPMNDGAIGGSRSVLNSINPEDIESMTVLKDASSTAIYGSRAANGVIMITTKKGKMNQEMQVSVNSSLSVSQVSDYVDLLSADEIRALVNQTGNATQKALLGTANTDWQKEIYHPAPTANTTVGISGNLKSVPYRLSVGHTYADGVLKTDNFQRGTAKLSLTPAFLDKSLRTEFNVSGSFIKNRFADRDAIRAAIEYDPTQSVYGGPAKYDGYHTWLQNGNKNNNAPSNPLALLYLRNNTATVNRLISNVKVDYTLPFFKDVTATINAGIDYTKSNGDDIVDKRRPSSSGTFNGTNTHYTNIASNALFDAYANYMKEIGKHNLSFMVGHSYQRFYFSNVSNLTEYFVGERDKVTPVDDKSRNVLVSFFGRANYSFNDRYMLTATLRADASSKLNPDDRWGYFPSLALAWNAKNESFLKEKETVNDLKLRLGYGEVGNVNGLGDYLFLTRYVGSINDGAYYQLGNRFIATARPESVNKHLKWEIGNTLNAGIDYGFFSNRFFGSLDVYRKVTKDLIAEANTAPFTNYGSRIASNIGDMENKGVEFIASVVPVRDDEKNINWTLTYNIAYNKNKITKLTNLQNVGGINGGTGNTVQRHQEGYAPYTFYLYEQVYDAQGKPIEGAYVDKNGDGKIDENDRVMGKSPYADVTMGLTTNLTYKQWDLNIATRASLGNYVYDNVSSANASLDRVYSDNILRNTPRSYYDTLLSERKTATMLSDMYLHDASFFKIDNITLGYNFPSADKLKVRLYATMQNVLTLTKYKGLDPEVLSIDSNNRATSGIDNNVYPRPKTYLFGVNLNF